MIPLHRSAEVAKAHANGTPVVALESTIITHGMPYPQNLEVARQVEADVREAGAIPATIAVIDGRLHIGLEDDELTALCHDGCRDDDRRPSGRDRGFRHRRYRRRA